ncbi:MAG: DinB family protein [Ignavibacteriaceae bacterium]|nr:DinB family protein [Ignavibacteriaceae bacterium]
MQIIQKPMPGEYPAYASMYIDLLPDDGLVLKHLEENFRLTKEFILSLPEEKLLYRYAPGKWTIKEILVHIIDDERIYSYRALRFARNDKTKLPGFDQDDFALSSNANGRDLKNIFDEYEAVRNATIALFNGLDDSTLTREGIADENKATVRALAYHIAGHELHHISFIKKHYL